MPDSLIGSPALTHRPVVTVAAQYPGNTTLRAVVGALDSVRLTVRDESVVLASVSRLAGAEQVRLTAPGLTLRAARADLVYDGRRLRITPYR